jgi:hypothetical protein
MMGFRRDGVKSCKDRWRNALPLLPLLLQELLLLLLRGNVGRLLLLLLLRGNVGRFGSQ